MYCDCTLCGSKFWIDPAQAETGPIYCSTRCEIDASWDENEPRRSEMTDGYGQALSHSQLLAEYRIDDCCDPDYDFDC